MPSTKSKRFLLVYGSETGQSKAIAEEIYQFSDENGLDAELHCLSVTDKKFSIEREPVVVLVVSTTGEGDPPETARKFWRRLKKKTLGPDYLSKLNFAILGLGDSNYTSFCNCSKSFNRRLLELGGKHFYEPGFADDAVGLEVVVEPWIEGLWPALHKILDKVSNSGPNVASRLENSQDNSTDILSSHITKSGVNEINGSLKSSVPNSLVMSNTNEPIVTENTVNNSSISTNSTNIDSTNSVNGVGNGKINVKNSTTSIGNGKIVCDSSNDSGLSSASINNEYSVTSINVSEFENAEGDTKVSSASINECKIENENENKIGKGDGDTNKSSTSINNVESESSTSVPNDDKASGSQVSIPKEEKEEEIVLEEIGDGPSLRKAGELLAESGLSLPLLSPGYLSLKYIDEEVNVADFTYDNGAKLPSQASEIFYAPIVGAKRLTRHDAVKTTLEIELDIQETDFKYTPGDSFSVICPNSQSDVKLLLKRLELLEFADKTYELSVLPDTKKKNASIPEHLPKKSTLNHIFINYCDIRAVPKKTFIRTLVEYTTDPCEKRRLQELCSKQGATDYSNFVRENGISIIDLLYNFPSCMPPIERILENMQRLLPRPYSISSSPLANENRVNFAFNIMEIPKENGRIQSRHGVCTGWLNKITSKYQTCVYDRDTDLEEKMKALCLENPTKIGIFQRTVQKFHLPESLSTHVIMVGPGTGVTPFLGFLRHRASLLEQLEQEKRSNVGKMVLFYGCRHKERDFLFKEELLKQEADGVLSKLHVVFSREQEEAEDNYVQDSLLTNSKVVGQLIDEDAMIYVCGDANNMAKDVADAFQLIIAAKRGITREDARNEIMKLRLYRKYLEDIWT